MNMADCAGRGRKPSPGVRRGAQGRAGGVRGQTRVHRGVRAVLDDDCCHGPEHGAGVAKSRRWGDFGGYDS